MPVENSTPPSLPCADVSTKRLRILFIRHKLSKKFSDFQSILECEVEKFLSLHYDIMVIDQDFDYGKVCDIFNPDLVLLDQPGGERPFPVTITNAGSRPDIPLLGFVDQDPHDTSRVTFLRLLDSMKIERVFVQGISAIRHCPELQGRAFSLPLCIDSNIYYDYGLEKIIPFSIFSGMMLPNFYHWRGTTGYLIAMNRPTLIYTHPGYSPNTPPDYFPIKGVDYAKMLNRSHYSLADTTRLGNLVRKHLEIPACGTVLVAPASQELGCYGFRDMENCILGEGKELLAKIAHVTAQPDLYQSIRRNGHDLVHEHYTAQKWRGIQDWYECHSQRRPGETVQQLGLLGPFRNVPAGGDTPAIATESYLESDFTQAISKAIGLIEEGQDLAQAKSILTDMSGWLPHLNEPWVPMGIISLLNGEAASAKDELLRPYLVRQRREGLSWLDPEEVAWLWLCAVLLDDGRLFNMVGKMAEEMRHLSLRRMAWFSARLIGRNDPPPNQTREPGDRLSTHWTTRMTLTRWTALVDRILVAHGRPAVFGDGTPN